MNLFRKVRVAWMAVACVMAALPAAALNPATVPNSIPNTAYLSYTLQNSTVNTATNTVTAYQLVTENLTLLTSQTATALPGTLVTFSHTLTNTGSSSEQIYLTTAASAVAPSPLSTGGVFTPTSVRIYLDASGTGVVGSGQVEITSTTPLVLAPAAIAKLLVLIVVPPDAAPGSLASLVLTAQTGLANVTASVTDTITVAGASISLTKRVSATSAKGGDSLTYTLTASNTGTASVAPTEITVDGVPASYILIEDQIPANTSLQSVTRDAGATALYHLVSETNSKAFSFSAPSDLATVDAVGFGISTFAAGASTNSNFTVQVHSNATGTIKNTAAAVYVNGSVQSLPSNTVNTSVTSMAPTVNFYNADYSKVRTVGSIGSNLYLQGVAAGCNTNAQVAENVTIRLTSSSSDSETFTALETGVNTGIFRILPFVSTVNSSSKAVALNDGILEVASGDKLTALLTCGAATADSPMYLDPKGIVFNSQSNAVISGATVTLIDVTGGGNGGSAGRPAKVFADDGTTTAPSTVTTGSDGSFRFPVVGASTYKLSVAPPNGYKVPSKIPAASMPLGRMIDASGSYLGAFTVSAVAGTVILDVPADPTGTGGLFLEKAASKQYAEMGDFVDYTVKVGNQTGAPLSSVKVTDTLPKGFRYIKNTARIGGVKSGDPTSASSSSNQVAVFVLGAMPAGQSITLTYRLQVGPGTVTGKATNSASASSGNTYSNKGAATVIVGGGVFSDLGYILGRVTTAPQACTWKYDASSPTWVWECLSPQGGGVSSKPVGVPGVRIFMEDGTYAITDENGMYSLFAIKAQTHALKVDTFTIPPGARLLSDSHRNGGDGGTVFVDMKYGELRRADFAIEDTPSVQRMIAERLATFASGSVNHEVDGLSMSALGATPITPARAVAQGASSGTIGNGSMSLMRGATATQTNPSELYAPLAAQASQVKAREEDNKDMFKDLDSKLGFINLKDGETVSLMRSFWVKGPQNGKLILTVNGKTISADQIGSAATLASKEVSAWLYIGVPFELAGSNVVTLRMEGKSGEDSSTTITVFRPTAAAKLRLALPQRPGVADGKSLTPITVEVLDENGHRVADQTAITLQTGAGKWMAMDYDDKTPGVQTYVSGGYAVINLRAPLEPADVKITASIGKLSAQAVVTFVPEARPMVAVGVMEYALNFSGASSSVVAATGSDGFENSLKLFSSSSDGGGARSAVFLKGKILGSDLLTLAYDSNKNSGTQLFRDVQPDQFYPVYGDNSTKGFDAQSASKLYLRVDNGRNYLFYGDYQTGANGVTGTVNTGTENASSLSATDNVLTSYNRTVTGARQHWENDRASVTSFASYNSFKQVVEEFAADGTSGPYTFKNTNGVANSETVLLLHRDRNQPSVVVKTDTETRYQDYEFEPFTGRLLFKSAVPMLDTDGNPIYIRVTYEVDSGGSRAWMGGLSGQYRLTNALTVGAIAAGDGNSEDPNQLYGLNMALKLPFQARISGELAETHHQDIGSGIGYRLAYKQETKRLKADFHLARTTSTFDNLSSSFNQGSGEAGGKLDYAVNKKLDLIGEFARTENVESGSTTVGAKVALQKKLPKSLILGVGMRYAASNTGSVDMLTGPSALDTNYQQTTVIAKVSRRFDCLYKTALGLEFEQDTISGGKHDITIDTSTPIPHGRVYFRHELISSLGNQYQLNGTQSNMATLIGIESDAIKKLHLFTEYRDHDELSNRNTEAAAGLRESWQLNKNVSFSGTFETVRSLNGWSSNTSGVNTAATAPTNSIAVTGSTSFFLSGVRGSARAEYRTSTTGHSFLTSFSAGKKITPQWTLLSRNILMFSTTLNSSLATVQKQVRFQTGAAYRGSDASRWDALALIEYRLQDGSNDSTANADMAVFSTHLNYQPAHGTEMNFRYATKWLVDNSNSLSTRSYNQLFSFHTTHDLGKKLDVGVIGSVLSNTGLSQRQNNIGAELGYQLKRNLWLSSGYNFKGFVEKDLPGGTDARQGAFIRLRFKFDESLLKGQPRTQMQAKNLPAQKYEAE